MRYVIHGRYVIYHLVGYINGAEYWRNQHRYREFRVEVPGKTKS